MWNAVRMGSTPPWWCTSTSISVRLHRMWRRRSPTTNANCGCATPRARCGSRNMVSRSGPGAAPAPSAAGCAALWNTATAAAGSPGAGPPAACTHITSFIGRTAGKPNCTTWCWCARIINGCITSGSSRSPDPLIGWSSPMPRAANSTAGPLRGHPPRPALMCRPAPDRPGNAPNGGGTNPSNHHPHRRPTRRATRATEHR